MQSNGESITRGELAKRICERIKAFMSTMSVSASFPASSRVFTHTHARSCLAEAEAVCRHSKTVKREGKGVERGAP